MNCWRWFLCHIPPTPQPACKLCPSWWLSASRCQNGFPPNLEWHGRTLLPHLRSLQEGEDRAVGVALSLLQPAPRLARQRFIVLPRAFSLFDVVGHAHQKKLSTAAPYMLKKLEANPDRLRDQPNRAVFDAVAGVVGGWGITAAYALRACSVERRGILTKAAEAAVRAHDDRVEEFVSWRNEVIRFRA